MTWKFAASARDKVGSCSSFGWHFGSVCFFQSKTVYYVRFILYRLLYIYIYIYGVAFAPGFSAFLIGIPGNEAEKTAENR